MKLSEVRKTVAYYLAQPMVRLLVKTSVSPSAITWFGLFLAAVAAVLVATGYVFTAGFVVIIAGFCDMLDGALARSTNRTTNFGAVLDSTLDRIAEAVLLFSLLFLYAGEQSVAGILLVGAALIGSLMVSYVRARAEAVGLECEVGWFTRPERVIVLALGLLLYQIDYALNIALAVIVIFSFVTVGQRVVCVWRQTKN